MLSKFQVTIYRLINWIHAYNERLFNFFFSRNWAHALDPMLSKDQMTETETSILPNWCHIIKIK